MTKIRVLLIVLVVRKKMRVSKRVMQGYREFSTVVCFYNPRQITLGHYSEHHPLIFPIDFFPISPHPSHCWSQKRLYKKHKYFGTFNTESWWYEKGHF